MKDPVVAPGATPVLTRRATGLGKGLSHRERWLLYLLAWVALVTTGFAVVVFLVVRQSLRGDVDQFVRDKAFLLGYQAHPNEPAHINSDERLWRSDRYIGFGQVLDARWNVVFKSSRLEEALVPSAELRRLANHPVGIVLHDVVGPDGTRYRMATVRIERRGLPDSYAQVGVRESERDRPLRALAGGLAGGVLVAVAVAAVGLSFLLRQANASLVAMSETARRLHPGTLDRQRLYAPPDAPELVQLADTFNALLDRLETLHASQHRFVADASHELRTPLATVRAEIDVALRRERSPEEYRETLEAGRIELERLSSLVDNLLALVALDARRAAPVGEILGLVDVARDAVERLAVEAAARQVRLELDASGDVPVKGDTCSLERVVRNLVENALRHTPPGERVVVRIRGTADAAILEVEDTGVGIAEEHLPRIFDRFHRLDSARNRAHGGAGLGLSIVKAIVESHGGTVSVRSRLGSGSTFTVVLPRPT